VSNALTGRKRAGDVDRLPAPPPSRRRCCANISPQNAARPFGRPAPVLGKSAVLERLSRKPKPRVLEIGAGSLRNALFLQRRRLAVTVIELTEVRSRFPTAYDRFEARGGTVVLNSYSQHISYTGADRRASYLRLPLGERFDLALATFVIETVCDPAERMRILTAVREHLVPGGALVLSVRGEADVVTAYRAGTPCSDGYLTPHRTFIRPYSRQQLNALLERAGFGAVQFLHKGTTKAPEYLHAIAEV
jgi:SAM-dependent methyltransferase